MCAPILGCSLPWFTWMLPPMAHWESPAPAPDLPVLPPSLTHLGPFPPLTRLWSLPPMAYLVS